MNLRFSRSHTMLILKSRVLARRLVEIPSEVWWNLERAKCAAMFHS